jgi:hypothetical protein
MIVWGLKSCVGGSQLDRGCLLVSGPQMESHDWTQLVLASLKPHRLIVRVGPPGDCWRALPVKRKTKGYPNRSNRRGSETHTGHNRRGGSHTGRSSTASRGRHMGSSRFARAGHPTTMQIPKNPYRPVCSRNTTRSRNSSREQRPRILRRSCTN